MNPMVLNWIGYIASFVVLISLLMSSVKKLRWINLVGAVGFAFYGFMIGSLPTGFMNVGIAIIDIVYLVIMYRQKDYFRVIDIDDNSNYYSLFVDFYKKDITKFIEVIEEKVLESKIKLWILRNMTPAGVFIADELDSKTLEIKLDYVIPQYRDFKIGKYVFTTHRDYFKDMGYEKFVVYTDKQAHIDYLLKMGFTLDQESSRYVKSI